MDKQTPRSVNDREDDHGEKLQELQDVGSCPHARLIGVLESKVRMQGGYTVCEYSSGVRLVSCGDCSV
jgi:hypothetical protein